MKNFLALSLVFVFLFALSACTNDRGRQDASPNTSSISRDAAINAALQKAGLARNDVFDIDAELDYERNGKFWEVDFETREFEYSYDIDATTGEIAREQKEFNN